MLLKGLLPIALIVSLLAACAMYQGDPQTILSVHADIATFF